MTGLPCSVSAGPPAAECARDGGFIRHEKGGETRLFLMQMSVEFEESLAELVALHRHLSSALSGQIGTASQKAVAQLVKKHHVLLFYVFPQLVFLLQVFLCVGTDQHNGGNRGDDVQIIDHVAAQLLVLAKELLL